MYAITLAWLLFRIPLQIKALIGGECGNVSASWSDWCWKNAAGETSPKYPLIGQSYGITSELHNVRDSFVYISDPSTPTLVQVLLLFLTRYIYSSLYAMDRVKWENHPLLCRLWVIQPWCFSWRLLFDAWGVTAFVVLLYLSSCISPQVGTNLTDLTLKRKKVTVRELGGCMGPIWSSYFTDCSSVIVMFPSTLLLFGKLLPNWQLPIWG